MEPPSDSPLLRLVDLQIAFRKKQGLLPVVDGVTLTLHRNEAVGIVGESGSGKTMVCRSLIGTLPRHGASITGGRLFLEDRDLTYASEKIWRRVRGRDVGYVPQSSLAGLNPVMTIEAQLIEAITAVRPMSRREAALEAIALLDMVRVPRAASVLNEYAAGLSGGMRQRVMIAAALAQRPRLLVADEPTTALDVSVQKEILSLIRRLRQELGMALVLVSHDLAVIEEVCDTMMVMYAGASFETGPVPAVAGAPRHPYTRALRESRVDTAERGQPLEAIPGEPPTIGHWPDGCRYRVRCPMADAACRGGAQPPLRQAGRQWTACLHAERMDGVG